MCSPRLLMAEKVSRQTGHCRAGYGGLLGLAGQLLCEAGGETGREVVVGESVRSMVSSSLLDSLGEETWDLAWGELLAAWLPCSSSESRMSSSVVSSISMRSTSAVTSYSMVSWSSVSGGL